MPRRHRRRMTSAPYTPNQSLLADNEPQPVTTGYLWYCLKASRLPRSLKKCGREASVKYLLLLRMFPSLETLLLCPKTSKRHTVSFSDFDGLTFTCSKCNVAQKNSQLSPAHRGVLQLNYDRYLIEKEKDEVSQRLVEEIEEFIADIDAFLAEVKSPEAADQV
ncbi:hypothetical protein VKT23_013807 [Stygiomarasmius scandens]|uniref:Uncharacterized protein n=1 Tax=Marasmiellus scandens TaxID=2682957 RepID=A0ABR1J6J3_9AGAR